MTAEKILQIDRTHIWHPYASIVNPPPVEIAVRARGLEIELASGERLLDAVSSWWCVAHGHNHPAIVEAIRRQSEKMTHVMFGGFTHEPAARLAERLAAFAPPGLDRVFFADSGSIAVEVATKMAVQYQHALGRSRRTKLVALKGGYHGDTVGAMALSDPDGMHTLFRGIMPQHFFAEQPRTRFDGVWQAEDFESLRQIVDRHSEQIAGIICEPVLQAANAMWHYHPQYLREMRRLCDERGLLLIFDEIAAGFYRTGPRWAQNHASIRPDIMCVGKALTGGAITLAATLADKNVAGTISAGTPGAFMHGPTYMANPLACAAACSSLELFENNDYETKVRGIETLFKQGLAPLAALPNVRDVRVIGACGIVETRRLPAPDDIRRVIHKHGVWLRPFSNFIYSFPPLVATEIEIRRIIDAIAELAACPPGPVIDDGGFHE
ncbi:MAG: adenosylmethionine--8-amino-7-oxononanoate transaminase [Opitutales bacterium]|nr:adenosylmethionine--8-amino-7-oxononanoate transaminase [Opitutales bacterium]